MSELNSACQTDQHKQLRDSHCTYTIKTVVIVKSIGSSNRAVINSAVSKQFKVRLCCLLSCFLSLTSKHAFMLANLMLNFVSLPSVLCVCILLIYKANSNSCFIYVIHSHTHMLKTMYSSFLCLVLKFSEVPFLGI